MRQIKINSNGKNYRANIPTDDGIGNGFAVGQLVLKSMTSGQWFIVTASGSAGAVSLSVSQSALPFMSGPVYAQGSTTASIVGYTSFFEQNYPYQIVASNNGNAYAVYLTGTAPTASFVVSQSIYGKTFITTSMNAVIQIAKPFILLQSSTDGNYYQAGLTTSASVTTIAVNQSYISRSFVNSIY